MQEKSLVLYVGGGTTWRNNDQYEKYLRNKDLHLFSNPRWDEDLLQSKKFNVIHCKMPCKYNAVYEHWKIFFEKYLKELKNRDIFVIGYSLGAVFLAKFLNVNNFLTNIKKVALVAPPFKDDLPNEPLCNGFEMKNHKRNLNEYNVKLFFSKDDPIVPLEHANYYKEIVSQDKIEILENKNGHFITRDFQELYYFLDE